MSEENKNQAEQAKPAAAEMPAAHKFIIGEKVGMTQVFDAAGELHAVSVVKAGPCRVVYTRTRDKDGYSAVCLGFGHKDEKKFNKAMNGQFKKFNTKPLSHMKEFRVEKTEGVEGGQTVSVGGRFAEGDYVDLQGVSKGKGFAGGMKRHNFKGQPASHGASDRERAPGSLASRRSLGRVLPGQRMAGHLGMDTVTMQKIRVVKVVPEENLLFLNGSVPGAAGTLVYVQKTVKKTPKPVVPQAKKGKKDAVKAAAKKPAAAPAKK